MPIPTATVTEFCGLLARSRLLPATEVDALHEKWAGGAAGGDADVDGFRRFLVAGRYLTEYQAALVQRGRADGFFVGGYVILDRIGKGRSAGVYRAVHSSGQVIALKVLPASKARNPQVLARFQREGRLLTQLNHPNIVRAYQLGAAGSVHYIAMEYLEGETLDEVLARRKQLPAPEAARVVYQALQGLQHLYERRMVHRDLKPANLMAVPAPGPGQPDTTLGATIKILDIGLGRELFDEDAAGPGDPAVTADGAILGTPDYLAPEQARDARGADVRADVYALGCVLYHLLAGRPPFVEKSVMATMVKHATEPVPPVTQFAPAVPPGMLVVMSRMLAKDPAGRYQTPGEAAAALRPSLPADAPGASDSKVLPAFEEWLSKESPPEPAAEPPQPPATRPGAPQSPRLGGSGLRPALGAPAPAKPGTGTVPALGTAVKPGTGPAPALGATTRSGVMPTVGRSGVVQVAGLGAAALKPSSVQPSRAAAPLPEFDVDLVPLPEDAGAEGGEPRVVATPPTRALYDLDRRDFIMLAVGAGGVITAIVGGFVAAITMGKKKIQGEEEGPRENQP